MARTDPATRGGHGAALYLIGIYKLLEGTLLVLAGLGALRLMHRDIQAALVHWVHVLRVDPDNHYIHGLLEKAFSINPKQLRELSVGTFLYAGLRYAEGVGLVLKKRWGEYLTVVATGVFIPLEIYEIFRHTTWLKIVIFILNVLTLVYLIYNLRKRSR